MLKIGHTKSLQLSVVSGNWLWQFRKCVLLCLSSAHQWGNFLSSGTPINNQYYIPFRYSIYESLASLVTKWSGPTPVYCIAEIYCRGSVHSLHGLLFASRASVWRVTHCFNSPAPFECNMLRLTGAQLRLRLTVYAPQCSYTVRRSLNCASNSVCATMRT